jgi:hypothetical protein
MPAGDGGVIKFNRATGSGFIRGHGGKIESYRRVPSKGNAEFKTGVQKVFRCTTQSACTLEGKRAIAAAFPLTP